MAPERFCFRFDPKVPLEDVAAALLLSRWGAESLHGEAAVQLEARHHLDAAQGTCTIEALTAAGHDLAKLFLGFLRRELAPALFKVERLPVAPATPAAA